MYLLSEASRRLEHRLVYGFSQTTSLARRLVAGATPGRLSRAWLAVAAILVCAGVVVVFRFARPTHRLVPAPAPQAVAGTLPLPAPPAEEVRPSPFPETPPPVADKPKKARPKPKPVEPPKSLDYEIPVPTGLAAPEAGALPLPPVVKSIPASPAVRLPAGPPNYSAATATCEPAKRGVLQRVVGKVPGLRRMQTYSAGEGFVPAKALRPIRFYFPKGSSPELTQRGRMDVRARLEPSGKVSRVELVALPDQQLVALLSYAANDWEFTPAQINGKPVASEMILHFTVDTAR